jgi:hypothetical protein
MVGSLFRTPFTVSLPMSVLRIFSRPYFVSLRAAMAEQLILSEHGVPNQVRFIGNVFCDYFSKFVEVGDSAGEVT